MYKDSFTQPHRSEIDGLRAIAVVPIILFHANTDWMPGGFLGVDIFFVISGYLITQIIYSQSHSNKFSFVRFYERRIRRLFPALFFVVFASTFVGYFTTFPSDYQSLASSAVSSLTFTANVYFWLSTNYFSQASELMPLLHLWSLSVEEQFYLFFPALIVFSLRVTPKFLAIVLLIITIVSFALSAYASQHHPAANFYLLPMRVWEFTIGALTFLHWKKRAHLQQNITALFALSALILSLIFFGESTVDRTFSTAVAVIATALVIRFATPTNVAGRLLSLSGLVSLGLISYSLYLWHQPVFAFARYRSIDHLSHYQYIGLILFTLVLAGFSWAFIEQPFRKYKPKGKSQTQFTYLIFLCCSLGLIIVNVLVMTKNGFPERFDHRVLNALETTNEMSPLRGSCHLGLRNNDFNHPKLPCLSEVNSPDHNVIMIGDSHLDSIAHVTQLALRQLNVSSYAVSYSGCLPLPHFVNLNASSAHRCSEYVQSMLQYAEEVNATHILLFARFPFYIDGRRFDNLEGGVEFGGNVRYVYQPKFSSAPDEAIEESLKRELNNISSRFKLIIVNPAPEAGWDVPLHAAKIFAFSDNDTQLSTSLTTYNQRVAPFHQIIDSLNTTQLSVVKTEEAFCDSISNRCALERNGELLYRDDDHLSFAGARAIAELLVEEFTSTPE